MLRAMSYKGVKHPDWQPLNRPPLPGHVLAGLPPGEASDGAWMGQVDEGEGQLSMGWASLWGCEKAGHSRLPLNGAVPHLHQAVILHGGSTG